MKHFVTFGQSHVHFRDGKTFDKDCVAVLNVDSAGEGVKKAFETFGKKFCFEYTEQEWEAIGKKNMANYYPRGYIWV